MTDFAAIARKLAAHHADADAGRNSWRETTRTLDRLARDLRLAATTGTTNVDADVLLSAADAADRLADDIISRDASQADRVVRLLGLWKFTAQLVVAQTP